jgi:hypothetical protein
MENRITEFISFWGCLITMLVVEDKYIKALMFLLAMGCLANYFYLRFKK